jgi:hypothetical protein
MEHAIGGVKRRRIVRECFRCAKFVFDDPVMLIACGLHNFRISLLFGFLAGILTVVLSGLYPATTLCQQ